jgi:hypothetical protein
MVNKFTFFFIVHLNHETNLFFCPQASKYYKEGFCGGCDLTHTSTSITLHPSPCNNSCRNYDNLSKKHGHCFKLFFK